MAKRILVIEDDELIAQIYDRQLRAEGYEAKVLHDGKSAVATLTSENFDLVLLDIMMPGMNGLDVLRELKKNSKSAKVPVVMLSNLSEDSTIKEALHLGAVGYLKKIDYLPAQAIAEVKKFLS